MVTAPGGSAEVIPFLKTWVNLPGAVLFTLGYSALSNCMGGQALFYTMLSPFLAFFGSFAAIIYPVTLAPTLTLTFICPVTPCCSSHPKPDPSAIIYLVTSCSSRSGLLVGSIQPQP